MLREATRPLPDEAPGGFADVTRVSSSSWHHAVMGCNRVFFFFPIFPIFSTDAPTTPLHRAGKYRIDKSAGPGITKTVFLKSSKVDRSGKKQKKMSEKVIEIKESDT